MNQYEYLNQYKESVPQWLMDFKPGDRFDAAAFLSSSVVFYPGSATDGHAIKLFGSTHSAHCFVYADYWVPKEEMISTLEHPQHGVLGYHTLARIELKQIDLVPHGWTQHIDYRADLRERPWTYDQAKSYGFVEILERSEEFGEDHGGKRLAVLFLGADGIATYDALFCQDNGTPPPFAMLLQDHGFGGNYDHFGDGGLLHRIASRCNVFPSLILVAEHSNPWSGYAMIDGLAATKGGMHNHQRFLYARYATP
jgi:hypothetical protein